MDNENKRNGLEGLLFILFGGVDPRSFKMKGWIGGVAFLVFLIFLILNYKSAGELLFQHTTEKSPEADKFQSTTKFIDAMRACALGLKIEIKGDIHGSLKSFYEGLHTKGDISTNAISDFLSYFPQTERTTAYSLYAGCLKGALVGNADSPQDSNQRQEFFAYQSAIACIRSSCNFEHCFIAYAAQYPFGAAVDFLKNEATKEASSDRCKPSKYDGSKSLRCITINGQQQCG